MRLIRCRIDSFLPSLVNELFILLVPVSGAFQANEFSAILQGENKATYLGLDPIPLPLKRRPLIRAYVCVISNVTVSSLSTLPLSGGEYRIRTDDP